MFSCMMNDLILHTFLRTSELKSINGFTPNLRVTDPRWIRYMMLESKRGVMSPLIFWVTNLLVSWFSWLHTYWCPDILSGYTRTCNYTCVLILLFAHKQWKPDTLGYILTGVLILSVQHIPVCWYSWLYTHLCANILGYTLTPHIFCLTTNTITGVFVLE